MSEDSRDIAGLAAMLRSGETTPQDLAIDAFDRIERWEPHIRSVIMRLSDRALERATELATELAEGLDRGPLHGIPIAIKDIVDIAGLPTTAASKILADNVARHSATVVSALEHAGAVIVAKTNTHEFAFGALTPPTRNPFDHNRMPGGSSGGSAAIVGAGVLRAAVGTDTAGSIREPAAMCGAVGLKPTAGCVSNDGVIPLAWTLDTVGPIAASVEDSQIMLSAMSRADRSRIAIPTDIANARIAFWAESGRRMQDPVRQVLDSALASIRGAVRQLNELAMGDPDDLVAAAIVIVGGEALSYHRGWLAERPGDYSQDVKDYLDLSTTFTAADYVDASRLGQVFSSNVDRVLRTHDVIITPSQVVLPPDVTTTEVQFEDGRHGPRDLALIRTLAPFNLSGHPAVSVPVAYDEVSGLPISVQLVGPHHCDQDLLRLAGSLQKHLAFTRRIPTISNR